MENDIFEQLAGGIQQELYDNILPFWQTQVLDYHSGGFIGRLSNDLIVDKRAHKGLILNARLLWSYSAFYRFSKNDSFQILANRAYNYLLTNFWDDKFKGAFWFLDAQGHFIDDKKKIYGHAFCIYALVEYYLATKNKKALKKAIDFYKIVEKHGYDTENQGYFEAFERNWKMADDLRLSAVDMNEKKSMNNHLHVLEAYTHLFRVYKNRKLEKTLTQLINNFLDHIIHPETKHFILFFNEFWQPKSDLISYGHDIEGSWLLVEAAEVLGNQDLLEKVKSVAVQMAETTLQQGFDKDYGLFYEGDPNGIIDKDKHWWPQAEAVIGLLNAFEITGDEKYLKAANNTWQFIEKYIIDKKDGEWFWKVNEKGKPALEEPKVSEWKSPYHNGRACIEALTRIERLKSIQK